jgi:hypothetical protein
MRTLVREHLEGMARVLAIQYEGKTDQQLETEVLDTLSGPRRRMEERILRVLRLKEEETKVG